MDMMDVNGHQVAAAERRPGEIITDVVVLTRIVKHDSRGNLMDMVDIRATQQTTGMIQRGMLAEAMDAFISHPDIPRED